MHFEICDNLSNTLKQDKSSPAISWFEEKWKNCLLHHLSHMYVSILASL